LLPINAYLRPGIWGTHLVSFIHMDEGCPSGYTDTQTEQSVITLEKTMALKIVLRNLLGILKHSHYQKLS
jgi:NO-binding membrane sensor protein with MHYT domain